MGRKAFAPLNCTSQVWRPTGWQWRRIISFFLEYLVVIFSIFSFSFLLFKMIFFICPYFFSNCLIVLSTESWNIMTLKVVKATVLMVRSFNENWPTKISTMTMKWKLSDKASQWNLQLVMYPLPGPICKIRNQVFPRKLWWPDKRLSARFWGKHF